MKEPYRNPYTHLRDYRPASEPADTGSGFAVALLVVLLILAFTVGVAVGRAL